MEHYLLSLMQVTCLMPTSQQQTEHSHHSQRALVNFTHIIVHNNNSKHIHSLNCSLFCRVHWGCSTFPSSRRVRCVIGPNYANKICWTWLLSFCYAVELVAVLKPCHIWSLKCRCSSNCFISVANTIDMGNMDTSETNTPSTSVALELVSTGRARQTKPSGQYIEALLSSV